MGKNDNFQTTDCEPPRSDISVALTAYGRARTVTPLVTGLYCKLSIGRIDGEHEQEVMTQKVQDLPPELYNAVYSVIEVNGVLFNDNLREVAALIDESDGY